MKTNKQTILFFLIFSILTTVAFSQENIKRVKMYLIGNNERTNLYYNDDNTLKSIEDGQDRKTTYFYNKTNLTKITYENKNELVGLMKYKYNIKGQLVQFSLNEEVLEIIYKNNFALVEGVFQNEKIKLKVSFNKKEVVSQIANLKDDKAISYIHDIKGKLIKIKEYNNYYDLAYDNKINPFYNQTKSNNFIKYVFLFLSGENNILDTLIDKQICLQFKNNLISVTHNSTPLLKMKFKYNIDNHPVRATEIIYDDGEAFEVNEDDTVNYYYKRLPNDQKIEEEEEEEEEEYSNCIQGGCTYGFSVAKENAYENYYGFFKDSKKNGLGIITGPNSKNSNERRIFATKDGIKDGVEVTYTFDEAGKSSTTTYQYHDKGVKIYPTLIIDHKANDALDKIKIKFSEYGYYQTLKKDSNRESFSVRRGNMKAKAYKNISDELIIATFNNYRGVIILSLKEDVVKIHSSFSNDNSFNNRMIIESDKKGSKYYDAETNQTIYLEDGSGFPNVKNNNSYYSNGRNKISFDTFFKFG